MKHSCIKMLTAMMLVIVLAVGMTAGYQKKAEAATLITVYWVGNGGKNNLGQTSHYTYYDKSSVTLTPSSKLYTRSGYTLTGFTTGGKTYSVGKSITVSKNCSIVCEWRKNNCTVKIWDYAISSQGVSKTTPKKTVTITGGNKLSYAITKASLPAVPKGYTRKWYLIGGTSVSTSKTVNDDMYVYYLDEPNTCTITFDFNYNYSEYNPIKRTAKTGQRINEVRIDPARQGYIFLGWSLDRHGEKGIFTSEHVLAFENNNSSITLYAQYIGKGETRHVIREMTKDEVTTMRKQTEATIKAIETNNKEINNAKIGCWVVYTLAGVCSIAATTITAGAAAPALIGAASALKGGVIAYQTACFLAQTGIAIVEGKLTITDTKPYEDLLTDIKGLEYEFDQKGKSKVKVEMRYTFNTSKYNANATGLAKTYPVVDLSYLDIKYNILAQ